MASKPIDPKLLAWFKGYVQENTYERTVWETKLSPNTIASVIKTGKASRGTMSRIEALQRGTSQEPETMQVREMIATMHAARMIALAAEAFPPDRQRLILDALPDDVRENMAIKWGALNPLSHRNSTATKV